MWSTLLWCLAGCLEPSCPADQVYSPVFGQCIGTEQPWTPPPPTDTGPATGTGDTSAQG